MRFMSWANQMLYWSSVIVPAETHSRAQKLQGKYGLKSRVSDKVATIANWTPFSSDKR